MLEKMAIKIATLNYEVTQEVEGPIYQEQTDYIAELLECYKNTKGANHKKLWNNISRDSDKDMHGCYCYSLQIATRCFTLVHEGTGEEV